MICLLTACGGIPIRSIPRLLSLQQEIVDANPAEFMLAIQVDQSLLTPNDAEPLLLITIRPAGSAAFTPVDEKLPMYFNIADVNSLGLPTPPIGRKWLIYGLTRESQTRLSGLQTYFESLKAQKFTGNIGIGIAQENVAVRDLELADTEWQSWIRTSRQTGFFEIWSGTVAELLNAAEQSKKRAKGQW